MTRLSFGAAFMLLASIASAAAYNDVRIADVPHIQQKPDFCGEACAAMWLGKLGKPWSQDDVFNISGVDPANARGCHTAELAAALRRIGFDVGPVWTKVDAANADKQIESQWKSLHEDLLTAVPSIVCMHYSDQPNTTEHFRLILGYRAKDDMVIYHEPAERNAAYRTMKRSQFMKLWPLKYDPRQYTLIRMRLAARAIANPDKPVGFATADYAQHIMKLKTRLPRGFSYVIQPPFVVIGDDSAAAVQRYASGTVKWAVERLKRDYFDKDPDEVLDIWLFKSADSYNRYTREIFKDTPTTPYGYFSAQHGALIMNIATGGGTLVHEIVHPFMRTNFPACPAWLNEGMGSLYEQSSDRNGHIIGLTNWRLAGLQSAIKKGIVPSFKELCSMDATTFYSENTGTNYAQARYLCYYLQERGLLVTFYKDFVANQKSDPTGYKTLVSVLGERDMDAFKKRWETFVLGLRFP
jgi:hypothetical protein